MEIENLIKCQISVLSILLIALKRRKLKSRGNKKIRRLWSRRWLQRRDEGYGMSSMIFNELKYEDPVSFQNYTRMSVSLFEKLLHKVEQIIRKQDTVLRESIPARTRYSIYLSRLNANAILICCNYSLLLTLRYLATGERYINLHYTFRISVPSICHIIPETINAIYAVLKDEFLCMPNSPEQWKVISDGFYKLWNFPNCLGALDGKHIAFRPRKEDGSLYFNYKRFHSIVLLALVDSEYNFINIGVGCNGRVSDGGVFANSSLCTAIENATLNFPEETVLPNSHRKAPYIILSDEAFKLTNTIMKPYGQRSLTCDKVFNYRLSRARRVVENAFGILANRFQILQRDINLSVDKVQNLSLTCCVLHNFIKKNEGKVYLRGIDTEDTENVTMREGNWRLEVFTTGLETHLSNRSANGPMAIRNTFSNYFNEEGFVPWQWEAVKKFNF